MQDTFGSRQPELGPKCEADLPDSRPFGSESRKGSPGNLVETGHCRASWSMIQMF